MTTTHTPGPWALDDKTGAVTWGDISFGAAIGAGGFVTASHSVCKIPREQSERLTPEHRANARLIAAAPELLAVLQAAVNKGYMWDHDPDLWSQATAVIAKAKGE